MTQAHGSYHFPTFSIIYGLENAVLALILRSGLPCVEMMKTELMT